MLDKLDIAKELVQSALDSFAARKATILHKAFNGELTAKWRVEHGIKLESWEKVSLGNCGQWFGGGTPSTTKDEYWDSGTVLWVTAKDMKTVKILTTQDKITNKAVAESTAKLINKPALLFVMLSGILRRTLPIGMTIQAVTINQDLKALVPNEGVLLEYLCWFCISREGDIREKCSKSGTTVESINSQALYSYSVNLPTLPEQQEITRILDSLLEKEKGATELASTIEKIDRMKKVILARAFRGELGTNDPNEESMA